MVNIVNSGIVFSNATLYVLFNNWVILVDDDLAVPSRSRLNPRNFLNVIVGAGPRGLGLLLAAVSCEKNC